MTHHLANLVRSRREQLHLSLVALGSAAVDPEGGGSVSHGWIHRLERGQSVIPPQLPQLRALAVGLRVPLPVVQEAAAAQFFGMGDGASIPADVLALAERFQQMAPERRDVLLGFLDAFPQASA